LAALLVLALVLELVFTSLDSAWSFAGVLVRMLLSKNWALFSSNLFHLLLCKTWLKWIIKGIVLFDYLYEETRTRLAATILHIFKPKHSQQRT